MADVVATLSHSRGKYPWEKWADGRAWRAKKGVDFQCSPTAFRTSIYMCANRLGVKVVVAIKGDSVEFQFDRPKKPRKKSA